MKIKNIQIQIEVSIEDIKDLTSDLIEGIKYSTICFETLDKTNEFENICICYDIPFKRNNNIITLNNKNNNVIFRYEKDYSHKVIRLIIYRDYYNNSI